MCKRCGHCPQSAAERPRSDVVQLLCDDDAMAEAAAADGGGGAERETKERINSATISDERRA